MTDIKLSKATAVYIVRRLTEYIRQGWRCDYNPLRLDRALTMLPHSPVDNMESPMDKEWLNTLISFIRMVTGILTEQLTESEIGLIEDDPIEIDKVFDNE